MTNSFKKRIRIIIVTTVFLIVSIVAPFSASADNNNEELASASYLAKMYYYALYSCTKSKINFNSENWENNNIVSNMVSESIKQIVEEVKEDGIGSWKEALEKGKDSLLSNIFSGVSVKNVVDQNVFTTTKHNTDHLVDQYITRVANTLGIFGGATYFDQIVASVIVKIIAKAISDTDVGMYISIQEGGGEDGSMLCGAGNNAIIKSALVQFDKLSQKNGKGGVTMKDIACDYSDPTKPGIFAGESDGKSGNCGAVFDRQSEDDFLFVADNRLDYLDRFAKEKLGYTQEQLLTFTDTELYYIYFWTFDSYCAEMSEGGDYPGVNAIKSKGKDGTPIYPVEFAKIDYQSRSKSKKTKTIKLHLTAEADGNKVKVKDKAVNKLKNGDNATCDNIYKVLSDDDNEIVKAFKEYVDKNEGVVDDPGELVGHNTDWCNSIDSALAWLVCPIIMMLKDTATKMYQEMIEPLLRVESTILGRGKDSVYDAWSTFRNIANIALIISILVIIFSQLTGIGIDNYGIKKSLPKIIIAAVLVNLSYIICQLSVDLSNLMGYGLNAIFEKLSEGVYATGVASTGVKAGGVATGVAVVSGTTAAVAGAAYLAPEMLVAAIPGILGALIAAVIAIFFFFFLLGARQAGIILLVVLSPLALACYMLPNTKSIFQKWKKMFTGLLVMYPIAGTLIGASSYASKLLLSVRQNNFWIYLSALLIAVVPFFFLPTLLKNSFSAIGNIGNKISNIGKRAGSSMGNTAKKGLQNSNLHQSNLEATKRHGAENRNRITSRRMDRAIQKGDYKKADGTKASSYKEMSDEEKMRFNKEHRSLSRRYSNDNSLINKDNKDLAERGVSMNEGFLAASASASAQKAGEESRDIDQFNNDTISAMDVGMYDENGEPDIDKKTGKQKTQKAFFDHKDNSWKIDTGKKDANGNAIYKAVSQKQMDEIKKAQYGQNPDKVRTGKDGEKEFTLNRNSGKYEDAEGKEATEEEMKEINENLAKGKMLHNYTRKNGQGNYTDSLGHTLENGEGIAKAGFSQSWADLQRSKSAEARARARGDLIGGYAGQSAISLANASQLNAENDAMSRTNIALGQADALHDMRNQGYNTVTSRIAGAQSAGQKLTETIQGNVASMEIERTAGVKALMTTALTVEEKAQIVNSAKAGKLEELMGKDSTSDSMKRVIRSMIESKKDYTSFGSLRPGSAEIKQDIEGFQTDLMNSSGAISTIEKAELITASKKGTKYLQDIVNSNTATSQQKAIARAMIASGTNYSSFGSSPQGSAKIRDDINNIESFMTNIDSNLTTAQKERLVSATKNGMLEASYLNNDSVSPAERYVAQKILDAKASNPNIDFSKEGYGSQFIKGIIDNNSGFEKVAGFTQAIQPPADNVLSIGRTTGQLASAISAGSTKRVNQFETQIAGEKAGEVRIDRSVAERQAQNDYNIKSAKNDINITPVITADYAQTLEKQRFDISQEKMYDEQFKLMPKGEMLANLRNLPNTQFANDPNYTRSLLKAIMQKGGDDDIMTFALNRTRTNSAEMEKVYDEFYAASTEPTLKAYGKFVSDLKNLDVDVSTIPTFGQWCQGSYPELRTNAGASFEYHGTKYPTLKGYVDDMGDEALQTASKGYIKVMSQNEDIRSKYEDHAIVYGMIHNRDNEAQAELRSSMSGPDWDDERRIKAMQTLSDSDIAHMTITDWNAVFGKDIRGKSITEVGGDQVDVRRLRQDILGNPRLRGFMPKEVIDFIGEEPTPSQQIDNGSRYTTPSGKVIEGITRESDGTVKSRGGIILKDKD